jgi:Ca2+:H+ antiporter
MILVLVTGFVVVMSEMLVGVLDHAAKARELIQLFVDVILVAIVGKAAEHSIAVMTAMKNKIDLALGIAVGSSPQIEPLILPILFFSGYLLG